MKKTLYLAGGGDEKQSQKIEVDFTQLIDGKKLMYIPLALERDYSGFEACYDWITKVFQKFKYTIDMPTIDMYLSPQAIAKKIFQYDAIYNGGGNTFKLLEFFYKNRLSEKIISFYEAGKPIYGGSAGAIIFGKDIRTVEEENDANYKFTEGFNFLHNKSIICHYNLSLDEKIIKFVNKFKQEVIAIPEDSGVKVEDGVITNVFGEAYIFKQNNNKVKLLSF